MALTGTLSNPLSDPSSQLRSLRAATGRSAEAGRRLAAVLLMVVAQAVVVAVAVLLLVLLRSGAPEATLTPMPTPQSAPLAP